MDIHGYHYKIKNCLMNFFKLFKRKPIPVPNSKDFKFTYENEDDPSKIDENEPSEYKGLRIGDKIEIPNDRCEDLYSNIVEITGFNPPWEIVHYTAPTIFGGKVHSGEFYKRVTKVQ